MLVAYFCQQELTTSRVWLPHDKTWRGCCKCLTKSGCIGHFSRPMAYNVQISPTNGKHVRVAWKKFTQPRCPIGSQNIRTSTRFSHNTADLDLHLLEKYKNCSITLGEHLKITRQTIDYLAILDHKWVGWAGALAPRAATYLAILDHKWVGWAGGLAPICQLST